MKKYLNLFLPTTIEISARLVKYAIQEALIKLLCSGTFFMLLVI